MITRGCIGGHNRGRIFQAKSTMRAKTKSVKKKKKKWLCNSKKKELELKLLE